MRHLLPSPAMVVALVALFLSLGGVSYGLAKGVIDGREIRNNSITFRDIKRDSLGGGVIKESKLGIVPSAAVSFGIARFAVVNRGGQARRSRSVSSVARIGQGRYQVIFTSDVRSCAYFATVGSPGGSGPPRGQATVGSLPTNPNGVAVRTEGGGGGGPQDRPFHLVVTC